MDVESGWHAMRYSTKVVARVSCSACPLGPPILGCRSLPSIFFDVGVIIFQNLCVFSSDVDLLKIIFHSPVVLLRTIAKSPNPSRCLEDELLLLIDIRISARVPHHLIGMILNCSSRNFRSTRLSKWRRV